MPFRGANGKGLWSGVGHLRRLTLAGRGGIP
ncbi:MAG: hypothetical protein HLUCCO18_13670 [Rhodobacteraceae bacterium HLUCCO18]|nr:MAG: hypothetical protein HLUCCO18_13670 [Rhodobacteraceae bacterium HLUCCO18]